MQKTMLLSTTTTTTWFLLILITFKTTHWTFLLMLDIPYLNFFLAHSIVSLDFKINGKWEKNSRKCGNYKWPKILKRFNLDFKKFYWKSSMKNIRAQKVPWKTKYFEKSQNTMNTKRNICLPKNTWEFLPHFSILDFSFSNKLKNFPTNICWSKKIVMFKASSQFLEHQSSTICLLFGEWKKKHIKKECTNFLKKINFK